MLSEYGDSEGSINDVFDFNGLGKIRKMLSGYGDSEGSMADI